MQVDVLHYCDVIDIMRKKMRMIVSIHDLRIAHVFMLLLERYIYIYIYFSSNSVEIEGSSIM